MVLCYMNKLYSYKTPFSLCPYATRYTGIFLEDINCKQRVVNTDHFCFRKQPEDVLLLTGTNYNTSLVPGALMCLAVA